MSKKEAFDNVVETYDLMRPKYTEKLFDQLLKTASIDQNSNILEVGCGTGQATEPFLKTGAQVTGIELGKTLVAYTKEKFSPYENFSLYCDQFENYPLEENAYDLIFSATAFHWIPPHIGYSKIYKSLKVGAIVALFWNRPSIEKANRELFKEIQQVYDQYAPDLTKKGGKTDYSSCMTWYQKTGFKNIQTMTFQSQREFRAETYVKLLETYSDHQSLDDLIKDNLYKNIQAVINKHGNRIRIDDTIELYLAQK